MVTPSGSHVKKHSLFGTTATWPSEAGAPAVIEGLGTAEAPLPRPSDAAGWLSLGWSIPFEGHAWIATAAGPSGDPQQITERHCYMAGLALDSQDASLWLLLAADMAAAEEALSDERRRELDDDNAPDLLWTVTVPGAGERLYADACYVRCLRFDSTSKRAAIAWAHLYRYLHRSNAIIEVGEDYVTANDCLRRCLSTDSTSACCLRALSDYLAANKLPGAACEGKSWSVADAAIGAIKSGFTTNSKIWSRLAWAIYSLHYESKFENRPLSVTLHEKEYSMVTAAASAIELDPQDEDAWFVIAMSPDAFHRLPPSHFYVAKDGRLADNLVTAAVLGVEHTVDKEGRLWYALCKAMSITKLSTVGILDRQWTFEECIHECLRREPAKIIYASTWCSHARRRSLHLEGRGPLTATELAVLAVETVPDSGEAWARLGEIMRNHERFEPGLRSVTVKGVEMTTLEVLERALTLTPDHMKAWYNYALEDSVPADVFVMPNGVIVTPVSLSAALVNMYIEEAGPWAWLGYTLLMSKQPYAVVAMREVSAFECFKQAYLRQPNFSSWRTVASMSTRDPLQFGDETLTRKECYRRSLAWDDEDALAWAELGELLTTLPYGERSVTIAEREYTAQECWLQAVNVAHPHYDAHGLAKAFFHLADDLEDATDTVDVALRPYFLADDIVDPAILKQREKVTLGKEQLLQRCIAVATTHGSRADRFEMRDVLDRATKALEVLQSP